MKSVVSRLSSRLGLPAPRAGASSTSASRGAFAALAIAAAACTATPSTAPTDGETSTAASALDPNGEIPPTRYKIQYTVIPTGTSQPEAGTNTSLPNQYIDYAGMAVQVNSGEPDPIACNYGLVSAAQLNGGMASCQSGAAGVYGQPLWRDAVVTSSSDVVTVALSLDNVQGLTEGAVESAFAHGLGEAGTITQGAGTVLGAVLPPPYSVIGKVVAIIGQGMALLASILPPVTTTSCAGGLLLAPPAGSKAGPSDMMTQTFTGAQLQTLTANGPITLAYPVNLSWNNYACTSDQTIQLTISRDWSFGTGPSAFAKSADSAVVGKAGQVDDFSLTTSPVPGISHQSLAANGTWNTELITQSSIAQQAGQTNASAQPVLGRLWPHITSISRTTTSFDVFVVDDNGMLWWAYSRSQGVWNIAPIVPSSSGAWFASDSRLAVVSPTPNTFDVFWVGMDGAVHEWSVNDTTVYGSTQPSATKGVSFSSAPTVPLNTTINAPAVTAASLAPPGAGIAGVARTSSNIDLFFAGKDKLNAATGGIWTSSFNGSAWNTYELAYSSGKPALGGNITATAQTESNIDVFFAGTDDGIWQASWFLGASNYAAGAPFSLGQPAYSIAELPGSLGLALPGQQITAVSPAPLDRLAIAAQVPGSLQVAWVGGSDEATVYVSAYVGNAWVAPAVAVASSQVRANNLAPISIVAPVYSTLDILFHDTGAMNDSLAATWNYPAPSYTVSQAPPEGKWLGWDTTNGGLISDPALTTTEGPQMFAAAIAPGGGVWYEEYDGIAQWEAWQPLGNNGNPFTDAPALVQVSGKLELFVRDPVTGHLLHQEAICPSATWCNKPTWNAAGWEDIGGSLIAGTPAVVVSQPNNEINVFATWTDGSAHTIQGTGYGAMGVVWVPLPSGRGWKITTGNWTNLSGGVLSQPGAVSWGPNRIDVLVRGANNQVYKRYSTDNGATWNPSGNNWQGIGGSAYSAPTVVSWGASRFDVFVGGSSGQVNHLGYNDGGAFNWDTLSGLSMPVGVRPAAVARGVWQIDVFGESTTNALFTTSLGASAWAPWTELASCSRVGGTPAVVSPDGVNLDLLMTSYAANGDGAVWHNSTGGNFPGQNVYSPPACP